MASTIENYALAEQYPAVFDPNNNVSLADQTATTAIQTAVAACAWFRAIISLKSFTLGSGTIGAYFELQASPDSGFGTAANIVTVATGLGPLTTANNGALVLIGCAPVTRLTYYRLKVTFSGSGSGTFDCVLDATP